MTLTEILARGVATGELYESAQRLIDRCKIGDTATKDFDRDTLELNGEVFPLKPMEETCDRSSKRAASLTMRGRPA